MINNRVAIPVLSLSERNEDIERIIEAEVKHVKSLKGNYIQTPVQYAWFKSFVGSAPRDYIAAYNTRWDYINFSPYFFEDRYTDFKQVFVFHELVHKHQYDYRKTYGNPSDDLSKFDDQILYEGDAWRLTLDYLLGGESENWLGKLFTPKITTAIIYGIGLCLFPLDVLRLVPFRDVPLTLSQKFRSIARGISYTRELSELGGEELVNFAFVYDQPPGLIKPKKLLEEFRKLKE